MASKSAKFTKPSLLMSAGQVHETVTVDVGRAFLWGSSRTRSPTGEKFEEIDNVDVQISIDVFITVESVLANSDVHVGITSPHKECAVAAVPSDPPPRFVPGLG
jgi:hypothetical protein